MSLKIIPNFFIIFLLISCFGDLSSINPVRQRVIESLSGELGFHSDISTTSEYTFVAFGDTHIASKKSDTFDKILEDSYMFQDNFIVVLGDLVNWGKASQYAIYKNQLDSYIFPNGYFTVIGNHDIFGKGWDIYKKLFGPSVYTFASDNARFIVLDNANGTFGREQLDWLEIILQNNNKKYIFVFSHIGIFRGTLSSYSKLDSQEETYKLLNLFRKYKVNYMVSGHEHKYLKKEINGTIFIITGSAGKRLGSSHYVRFYVNDSEIKISKIEI